MREKITIFYDFISAYSYIALKKIKEENFFKDYKFIFQPISLVLILKKTGNPGPMLILHKRDYYIQDVYFSFIQEGLKFNPPKQHPFLTNTINRFLYSVPNEKRLELSLKIFESIWEKGMLLETPEELAEMLRKSLLFCDDFNSLRQFIRFNDGRKKLMQANQKAFEKKVFGTPIFLIKDTLFWGQDRLKLLQDFLKNPQKFKKPFIR